MKDVAHHDDVSLRDGIVEEAARLEANPRGETVGGDVFLEDRADCGQIKADALKMRIGERDLSDEVALRSADVDDRLVILPGELARDGEVGSAADAAHGAEEVAEAIGVGVEGLEEIVTAVARLVLWFAGAKRGGEVAPEAVEASVGHLQDAADVRGLVLVEEEIGGRRIGVVSVVALEAIECDEGVEEVARGARMQADAAADAGESLRAFGEHREELEFNGAEQDLRGRRSLCRA